MEVDISDTSKIVKKTLYAGSAAINFEPETKVTFHFQTRLCNEDKTLIDDSRKWNKPMQLILGRKFKLPVWEVLVKNMALNEVAHFIVDKSLVEQYPIVSKAYRDDAQNKPVRSHCCFGSIASGVLGYEDLNELLRNPQNLEFVFELINVQQPGQYEKAYWQITDVNKREMIPRLKEEGNEYYRAKNYTMAVEKYETALHFIDQLQLREKPRDIEWNELNSLKLPFHLNLAQCKLCLEDYYAAIEHCNQVLEHENDNVKALFRRGKARLKVWSLDEAASDLNQVLKLDPLEKSSVLPLLASLKDARLQSKEVEKSMTRKSIF